MTKPRGTPINKGIISRHIGLYLARKDVPEFMKLMKRYKMDEALARQAVVETVRKIKAHDAQYVFELRKQRRAKSRV